MALLELLERGGELPLEPLGQAQRRRSRRSGGRSAGRGRVRGPLEELVNREAPLEDEVATVFDLLEEVAPAQVHGLALAPGELRAEHERPVVEPLPDDRGAQAIGGRLECGRVGDGQERVVVLAERDPGPGELLLDERVPVEVIGRVKRDRTRRPAAPSVRGRGPGGRSSSG